MGDQAVAARQTVVEVAAPTLRGVVDFPQSRPCFFCTVRRLEVLLLCLRTGLGLFFARVVWQGMYVRRSRASRFGFLCR